MTSISALIDFLMSLMSDDKTKREFEQNPDGTMADKGLQDVSAQDVRDARLIMADQGHARPRPEGGGGSHANGYHESGLAAGGGSSNAVREIVHTTQTFEIDQSKMIFNIDNHRTNILDSFNSADKVTAIQDNDTVIDIDKDDDEDDDKTDDKTDKPGDTDDKTDDPEDTDDGAEEPGEPKDGDEEPPTTDTDPDLPSDPGPPTDDVPGDTPGDPGPPTDDDPDVPMPEGDPNESFPTEPEPPMSEEPVLAEADDDLPVA
jgi:hypothetical protein